MDRWTSNGCAACMLLLAIGCEPLPTRTLDDIARGYVRAALAVAQHQPSLVEQWRGDAAWRPGARVPVAETRKDIVALITELRSVDRGQASSADQGRAGYLRRQLDALDVAARRLLGERMAFADEIVAAYGVSLPQADPERLDHARQSLSRLLPGSGSLGGRHSAFRRSVTIPPGREGDVLQTALDECRQRTREQIGLPADESVAVRVGVDSEWDGFARYQGNHQSLVEISARSPLDVSRALRLACHEGYPGHHVQHVLLDAGTTLGEGGMRDRPELLLQPAFGPHLLIAEGAAEVGADLAFPHEDRTRVYREVLLARAGLASDRAERLVAVEVEVRALESAIPEIVAAYLDSRTSRERAIDALANDAAVMDPESLLTFAERHRTRLVAYMLGRHVIEAWLAREDGNRWLHLASLFSTGFRRAPLER